MHFKNTNRKLWLLAALAAPAAAAVLAVAAVAAIPGIPDSPDGVIHYNVAGADFASYASGEAVPPSEVLPLAVDEDVVAAGEYESPDASAVAVVETADDGSVWLDLRESASTQRLAQLAGPGAPPLVTGSKGLAREQDGVPLVVQWSPDGRYLAYGTLEGTPYVLHVLDRMTGEETPFAVNDGYIGEIVWAPNGRYLAISSYTLDRRDHTDYVWDTQGDAALVRLTDGCEIVWSPDSEYIATHRDPHREPGIWVVSVAGDERWAVTDNARAFPTAWVE